jgi:hypothetical protein
MNGTSLAFEVPNNTERMRIDSSGNVGIGTNNPAYKLDVNGIIQSRPAASSSEPSFNDAFRVYTSTGHAAAQFGLSWYNSNFGFNMGSVMMSVGGGYNDCNLHFNTSKSRGTPTTKMVIDGDGNVGIGTNNPTHQLDIWHATRGEMDFNCNNTDRLNVGVNTTDGFVISENGGLLLWSSTSYVRFGAGGGEKMRILSGGNVGIGDSTPSYKLDVNGDINFTGTLRKNGTEYGAGGGSSFTKITETIPGTYGSISTTGSGGSGNSGWEGYSINGRYVFMSSDDSNVGLYNDVDNKWIMYYKRDSATTGNLRFYAGGVEKMRLLHNGNLGLGTTAPDGVKLDCRGKARFDTTQTAAPSNATYGGSGCRIILWPGSSSQPPYGFGINGSTLWYSVPDSAAHRFYEGTSEKVTIKGGNFGIGTTNPSQKLHIHGYYHQTNAGGDGNQFWTAIGNSGKGGLAFKWSGNGSNGHDRNLHIRMHNNSGSMIDVGLIENSDGNHMGRMNDFTGQHRCIPKNNLDADKYGLIVYSTGKYVNIDNALRPTMNDSLPICDLCSTENDIRVFGVISDDRDDNETRTIGYGIFQTIQQKANTNEKRIFINSVGEGGMWVCNKNGNISNGNYITPSSVPGYGVKQDSNQLLNSTVAKITCDCNFNLTPIVKQKLKVGETTTTLQKQVYTSRTETTTEITYNESLQKYVETTITETIDEEAYDTFQLYDTAGNPLVDESGNNKQYTVKRMENYTETKTELVYDSNGDIQYEDDIDANGQQQMEYEYDTRFLNADGSIIATEAEYNTKKANGENVYISCFVGCTYHCG